MTSHPFSFANVTDVQIVAAIICDECERTSLIMGSVMLCKRCVDAFLACQAVRDEARAEESKS